MSIQDQIDRVTDLEAMVMKMQAELFHFHVTFQDRMIMPILSDLLASVDMAKRDLHWLKKDLALPDIERWEALGD